MSVRERRRIESMRRIQTVALDLFEERGFDGVTIDEIATRADVSAPTIYRQFGTKEYLVFWDEYDPILFSAIAERLPSQPILQVVRQAIIAALEAMSLEEKARILRRARLLIRHPGLLAANAAKMTALRQNLAKVLNEGPNATNALESDVIAAVVVAAFYVAVEHWILENQATPLSAMFDRAFRIAADISSAGGTRS